MIVAYCNRCGVAIPDGERANVVLVVAEQEFRFHLCAAHRSGLIAQIETALESHPWRVKS